MHHSAPTSIDNDTPLLPTLRRFLPYLWPRDSRSQRVRILIAALCVMASKSVQVSMGFVYAAAINHMAPGMEPAATLALGLVLAYVGMRFSGILFDNLRNAVFERVGQDAARRLGVSVFAHLHKLSLRFHLSRRTGEVTKVIERGTKSIDEMLYFLLFNAAPTLFELIAVLIIFSVKFSPYLALVTAIMVGIYLFFTRRVTDWRNALRAQMNRLDNESVGKSVDSLLNYETVKYFGAERLEEARYATIAEQYCDAAVKSNNSLALLNVGQSFITNLMLALAMGWTVWGWSRGQFSTGDVVLVNSLLIQLFRPLDMLGMVYRTIRQGAIDMAAMFALIDTAAEIKDAPHAPALAVGGGAIQFDDVHFGYDAERPILRGLSFTLPAGQSLAIVGPSGSGKSTIARLLFRFFDVSAGAIRIDGQDIRMVSQMSLRSAIGIVPQDTVLFNDSIGYNIGYGRADASDSDISAAAHGAAIGNFIEQLPGGYASEVGERGLKLSGGEKQRIAIARTLLKNPPILILDEATSALDSRTEGEILATLGMIAASRTTITIAHRLSTIADADNILVLDKGRIAEQGNHASLLQCGGLYAEMWERQMAEGDKDGVATRQYFTDSVPVTG